MNKKEHDNLEELFGRFYGSEQAAQAAEEIRSTDAMLRNVASPEPDEALIADIKKKILVCVARKKSLKFRTALLRAAVVAAVVLIVATALVKFNEPSKTDTTPLQAAGLISEAEWESSDLAAADENISSLSTAIEQVENELCLLGSHRMAIEEEIERYELEYVDMENDFWKG
ncbi:MAG: hypothetical protein E4H40_04235 [Candidatus Brocadiia bacterium]|nr:MAG: hypothetical protein E4H40_04235 [Candidatus Brocadiia bacterium]